jgi:hypothetical protein
MQINAMPFRSLHYTRPRRSFDADEMNGGVRIGLLAVWCNR